MRKFFMILLLFLGQQSIQAQSLCKSKSFFYLQDGWGSFVHTVKAPSRWETKEYLILGATAGGVALAISQDESFRELILENPNSVKDGFAIAGEAMGNTYYVAGALVLSYGGACLFKNERLGEAVWVTTKSVVISAVITHTLKSVFNRQRPFEGGDDPDALEWFNGRPFQDGNKSFPSGHTTTAFAIASGLSNYYNDKWWVGAVAYPLAGLTAWSRMYDDKHWLSDIMAGAAIGIFTGKVVNTQENIKVSVMPSTFNGSLLLGFHYTF
ncbi:MAG: phosphatase PAP2 family protein [Owenweeksia sp.]